MGVDWNFRRHWKLVAMLGALVLVLCGQVAYVLVVKFFPNLVGDRYGIVYSSTALSLLNAQKEFFKKNGRYSEDISEMIPADPMHPFLVGYANNFPESIASMCKDCLYGRSSFKALILEKVHGSVEVWSIDGTGKFNGIGQTRDWPGQREISK